MEERSFIDTESYAKWFSSIWTDVKGQIRTHHPAPFPLEVPRRLIRMFSFAGDTVLDPFAGTGTTALAALETGRSSISVEIDPTYITLIEERLHKSDVAGRVEIHRIAVDEPARQVVQA
jgi:site-specific DNA-methyltransferase (adenine-specific)